MCPEDVRVACWVKTYVNHRKHVYPGYSWEPVIFRGGRVPDHARRTVTKHTDDSLVCAPYMRAHIDVFTGAKPPEFCLWLFNLMGMEKTDTLVDLFRGTGAVSVAWETFCRQGNLFDAQPVGGDPEKRRLRS